MKYDDNFPIYYSNGYIIPYKIFITKEIDKLRDWTDYRLVFHGVSTEHLFCKEDSGLKFALKEGSRSPSHRSAFSKSIDSEWEYQ